MPDEPHADAERTTKVPERWYRDQIRRLTEENKLLLNAHHAHVSSKPCPICEPKAVSHD